VGYSKIMNRTNGLKIRSELVKRDISNASIAQKLNVSRQSVTQIIYGQAKSSRIRQAIAQAIGRPVHEIWPDNGNHKEAA
jgi:lambda repressor-like predicted transcriptional regulator